MIETVISFVVALGLILLAQLGERKSWARWATLISLLVSGVIVLVAGLVLIVAPDLFHKMEQPFDPARLGWTLLVTGLFIVIPVLAGMILSHKGANPTLRGVPWTRPVHLTAWTLLVLFIGSNFSIAAMDALSEIELDHPLALLIPQNTAFVLAALIGVGWGIRRDWREVVERLGLSRPTFNQFLLGLSMSIIMLITTAVIGALIALIFGMDESASAGFNERLLQHLPGVWGVVLMGVATGLGEEMLFRGALQPVAGIWLTSLLFALSHAQYFSPFILVIFALGLILGFTRNKWGLNTAIWTHALYNTLVGLFALLAMNLTQFEAGM